MERTESSTAPEQRRVASPAAQVAPEAAATVLFVVFDIETSGFGATKARILQLAATAVLHATPAPGARTQRILQHYSSHTRPDLDDYGAPLRAPLAVAPGARAVHRITDATIAAAPPLSDALAHLAAWTRALCERHAAGALVLVAHNAFQCDVPFLFAEMQRAGLHPDALAPPGTELHFADTMFAWRRRMPAWHGVTVAPAQAPAPARTSLKLEHLFAHVFGGTAAELGLGRAHDALTDVHMLVRLLFAYGGGDGALRSAEPLATTLQESRTLARAIDAFEARADRTASAPLGRLANDAPHYVYAPSFPAPALSQRVWSAACALGAVRGGRVAARKRAAGASDGASDTRAAKCARTVSPYFAQGGAGGGG